MSKEERQKLLEELMAKEIKKMRKVIKKYNHEPLLYTPIEIKESNLEKDVAGRIALNENEDKWLIEIDTKVINDYYKETKDKWINKYNKRTLKGVIGHELTHGWVDENYNIFFKDGNRDSSIIFLNALFMFGYSSGHDCWFKWRWNSNNVVKCSNKKEFDRYVISIYKKFNLLEQAYTYNCLKGKKAENVKLRLTFPWDYNVYGLQKLMSAEGKVKGYNNGDKGTYNSKDITLAVGCMVDLDKLDQYIERALMTDVSNYKIYNYTNYTYKGNKLIREINKNSKVA
ncbi:hypothetical protein [Clostridium sp. UBA5988]|uniref:hypothetical protein n=1 Tax=Clostridium sp. UBA5988 TaxID=1946369 RepID=UPI0032178C2F